MALMKEKIVADINLDNQTVTVSDNENINKVKSVIESAGYTVK
jgi:copper chaperone CopZ